MAASSKRALATSPLSEEDLHWFNEGTHTQLYDKLGAHLVRSDGGHEGVHFAVWAPNAASVSVIGDVNDWDPTAHPLQPRGASGIWEGFLPEATKGSVYKYHIRSRGDGHRVDKTDPYGFTHEVPPRQASIVWDLPYDWQDDEWLRERGDRHALEAPMSIYEVHLGSWMRVPEEDNRMLTYRELAPRLADYVAERGFTHVELMPVTEHPFYGSWGYQVTGYFAPTSRYGTPQDFMYFVDYLHQAGIGVILDWVPSHFPTDEHGLAYFDGTHLYEHADPRQGYHPDWDSFIFNYGRNEVRSFLLSSAHFWLDHYHIDGLRVDAVASMLYLDYSREGEDWIPNEHGTNENLQAISFLRQLNETVYERHPDVQMIAEESTSWPMVSRPTYVGGLGFGLKWDMGWMHDALQYFQRDPIHRPYHHDDLTFRMIYAFDENFVLPLSHDEVVHGKGSILGKMPGDAWQQFANLRLLYGTMFTQPGKKLLFMGDEFGQGHEWDHSSSLDWHQLNDPQHKGIQRWVDDLNRCYRREAALHALDCHPRGFAWIAADDADNCVVAYLRLAPSDDIPPILVVANYTPEPRANYRVGVPTSGRWVEILNSDAPEYGGTGQGNLGGVDTTPIPYHGYHQSLILTLPPLGMLLFKPSI
ncbi:MAG: 1,4-alpha-glucan branching protein GlgB [Candidatus Bipolaricaulia bacterium]